MVRCDRQLDRFYAHDPEAKGFGTYVVFWFGDKDPWKAPLAPNGQAAPASALEMQRMLIASLPDAMKSRIAVIVIERPDQRIRRLCRIGDKCRIYC